MCCYKVKSPILNENFILPWSSTYLRAFSKKDGVPSISSNASKTGLPRTTDFAGERSFAVGKQKQEKEVDLCYWKKEKEKKAYTHKKGKKVSWILDLHCSWEPSAFSPLSFFVIPFCPIPVPAVGAFAKASSNAVFHSCKSSKVSAYNSRNQ